MAMVDPNRGGTPRALVGVDVGGTFTDAVVIADGVVSSAKVPGPGRARNSRMAAQKAPKSAMPNMGRVREFGLGRPLPRQGRWGWACQRLRSKPWRVSSDRIVASSSADRRGARASTHRYCRCGSLTTA